MFNFEDYAIQSYVCLTQCPGPPYWIQHSLNSIFSLTLHDKRPYCIETNRISTKILAKSKSAIQKHNSTKKYTLVCIISDFYGSLHVSILIIPYTASQSDFNNGRNTVPVLPDTGAVLVISTRRKMDSQFDYLECKTDYARVSTIGQPSRQSNIISAEY